MGGSIGLGTPAKRQRLAELAGQERVPLVMLLEGAGERTRNAFERRGRAPNDLQALARLSGPCRRCACVMGAVGRSRRARRAADGLRVMVEGAALFTAGPPVVEQATGEDVDKEELGGTAVHTAQRCRTRRRSPTTAPPLALVRSYLAYFPSNAWQHPPRRAAAPTSAAPARLARRPRPRRPAQRLRRARGGRAARRSPAPCSRSSRVRRAIVTALARLGGEPVAIVANQPRSTRARSTPTPPTRPRTSSTSPARSTCRSCSSPTPRACWSAPRRSARASSAHAARLFAAQARRASPKLHVTLRKAYGFGALAHGDEPVRRADRRARAPRRSPRRRAAPRAPPPGSTRPSRRCSSTPSLAARTRRPTR